MSIDFLYFSLTDVVPGHEVGSVPIHDTHGGLLLSTDVELVKDHYVLISERE